MSNVVQFRRSTAILTLVAASIGGGLIAAFAVNSHTPEPVSVVARADTSNARVSQLSNSFADIIEKASPAVVTIGSTRVVKASEQQGRGDSPLSADPFFRQFFGGPNAKPRDERERGLGSGVIVSPSGYILTNNHVVDKATLLKVELSDGRKFTAKTVGTDPQTDLAVIKISANDLPTLPFGNSEGSRVGDLCFAIGNPFGQDHTVTMGIVSAKGRKLGGQTRIQDFIQTDAAINPGNSGGALINAQGQLIGINTMILTGGGGGMFGGGEGGNVGIGFAVPSNMAKQVMDQIEKNGKVSRGYMGALLGTLTPELAPQFNLKPDVKGALISQVTPGGPAEKSGLKMGDVVTGIDGKPVKSADDLTMDVISRSPGSTVNLELMRDGKPEKLSVTLGQRPNTVDWDPKKQGDNDNGDDNGSDNSANSGVTVRGITVQALTPEIAEQIKVPAGTKGVVVTDVDQSSPAADANLGQGVVIIAVNRQPVASVNDFKRLMNEAKGKAALLTVDVGGQTGFTVVQPQQ